MASSVASDQRWWSLEVAPGWTVVPSALAPARAPAQDDDCVAIVPSTDDAALRIFAFDCSTRGVQPEHWIGLSGRISSRRGWPPEPWTAGPFAGIHARQPSDGVWWRVWCLAAGNIGLNAMYRCGPDVAGRDDSALDGMLRTLQGVAPAG